jgi:hypothetical protein
MYDFTFGLSTGLSIFFLIAGTVIIFSQRDKPRRDRHGLFNRIFGIILCLVGAVMLIELLFFSPSFSSVESSVNGALHSPAGTITEIDVDPYPNPQEISLTAKRITISDPSIIKKIADALNSAEECSPKHPASTWSAWITIKTKTSHFDFAVTQNDPENGTLINFTSGQAEGWNLGDYRSNPLGPLLEQAAHGR